MKKENNNRKYPGEHRPRPDNGKFRREEAKKRQEDYDKLSTKEKLAKLDEKLGPGQGAERQRAKLMAQLEKEMGSKRAYNKPTDETPDRMRHQQNGTDRQGK